jgi:hypothetical protein
MPSRASGSKMARVPPPLVRQGACDRIGFDSLPVNSSARAAPGQLAFSAETLDPPQARSEQLTRPFPGSLPRPQSSLASSSTRWRTLSAPTSGPASTT